MNRFNNEEYYINRENYISSLQSKNQEMEKFIADAIAKIESLIASAKEYQAKSDWNGRPRFNNYEHYNEMIGQYQKILSILKGETE